jgi:U3 small nucleolar RNA-associated protein 12
MPCCVVALADKTIKFWTWAVTTEQQQQDAADDPTNHPSKKHKKKHQDDSAAAAAAGPVVQRLGFQQTRQLEMSDDVLCVKVSPDGKLLAASLLDHTIKVYYVDR